MGVFKHLLVTLKSQGDSVPLSSSNVQNIKIGESSPKAILLGKYQTSPEDYRYDLTQFTVNTAAGHEVEIYNDRIIINKFRPNVWILQSPEEESLEALCAKSKNLVISIKGVENKAQNLFSRSYSHHSIVGGSGATIGHIRGVGIFPFVAGVDTSWYGTYASNRGELPFSAYIWDNLTYNDNTTVQLANDGTFRGDYGAGYNQYGKVHDSVGVKVIPDYKTFPTPFASSTLKLSIGLYTGMAVSFDAWQCDDKPSSMKMNLKVRNASTGAKQSAYCYSDFGTMTVRVSGLKEGDRLEYGTGVIAESENSILTDGNYNITYIEGGGFILYGEESTDPVSVELIYNKFLDSDGLVDITTSPIIIGLENEVGIDPSSEECWDAFVGDVKVWHKDKTLDSCWAKYGFAFPMTYKATGPDSFNNDNRVKWLTPLKFQVKEVPQGSFTLESNKTTYSIGPVSISYPACAFEVSGLPEGVTATVERIVTNIENPPSEVITLANGTSTIGGFIETVNKESEEEDIEAAELKFTFSAASKVTIPFTINILPQIAGSRTIVTTSPWESFYSNIKVPMITGLDDEFMKNTRWNMRTNNQELWNYISDWYKDSYTLDTLFYEGHIFENSSGLEEITLNIPSTPFNYGEDNFAHSGIKTINFVQTASNSHISSPQKFLRSASSLETINITWYNSSPNYIFGANSIADGMSGILKMSTYPDRLINWSANRDNIQHMGIPCTLMQYAFNNSLFTSIPAYPGTEDENTMFPARGAEYMFNNCSKLTFVGPILDMNLVVPDSSHNMFNGCENLAAIKIKNLNHGDWSLDGETRNGIHIGNLKGLNSSSINYLFANLRDLNTSDPSKHVDSPNASFISWNSDYLDVNTEDYEYKLTSATSINCRHCYPNMDDSSLIIYTDKTLNGMKIKVSGLNEDNEEAVLFMEQGSAVTKHTWIKDGTFTINNSEGTTVGFTLLGLTPENTNVTISIQDGLDLTNPLVSNAKLYIPKEWAGATIDFRKMTIVDGGIELGINTATMTKRVSTTDSTALAYVHADSNFTMSLKVQGLVEGDTLGIGGGTYNEIQNKITEDSVYTIEITGGSNWGFKLWNDSDTSNNSPVTVTLNTESMVTSDMISAANVKGWTIYIGDEEVH